MAKKQKQPTKTCADCIHESACRVWTDGRYISDASASRCPEHMTVKDSAAYPCGVLDERKRKQTNADRIRAMSDEELANWLARTQYENMMEAAEIFGTQLPFKEETLKGSEQECLQWLRQPVEGE